MIISQSKSKGTGTESFLAEDEVAYEQEKQSMIEIPNALVPKVRNLIAQYQSQKQL